MAEKRSPLLILCVDIDDDLSQKAKVKGPLIGKQANLDAATKLALADPADADANTMFEAIRLRDELGQKYDAEVATITGSRSLGYEADRAVIKQLETVITKTGAERVVFVSDGASDERVLPIVQGRIKIDSVKTVRIKQSEQLENTYFVILDKLKEPQFARIVFGIPGLALFLWFIIGDLGLRLFVGLFGAYLLVKGFGIEARIFRAFSEFEVNFERVSFVFLFAAVPLFLVSFWLAGTRVLALEAQGVENIAKLAAYFLKDLLLLLPLSLLLVVAGQAIEAVNEKKSYQLPSHGITAAAVLLLWLVLNTLANWVIGAVSFADFFYTLLLSVLAMVFVIYLAREFKRSLVAKMPLVGKEVYTQVGGLLGRVSAVGKRGDEFEVRTLGGQTIDFALANIASLGEKIVIKY